MATSTISCGCSSIGSLGKLLTEDTGSGPRTFDATSDRVEFIYETLGTERNLQHNDAITGSTSRLLTGVRPKAYLVQGVIALQPSPAALELWLPRILGGTIGALGSGTGWDPDGDTATADRDFPLANTLPEFDALVYRESGIFQYTDLQVAQAVIRGKTSNGGEGSDFMELIVVVVGETEVITEDGDASPWPATEPSLATGVTSLPYTFWETDMLINSTALPYNEFTLTIDNNLRVNFYDEITPQCIRSTGRDVTAVFKAPFTCDALEEALALNDGTGTAELRMSTNTLASPTLHTSIEIPYARGIFKTPVIRGKQDIPIDLSIIGYASAGNDELVVTNDAVV